MTAQPPTGRPLAGLRVIELAGIGPGPYAGQLLADMGAEVIVVDRPSPSPVERDVSLDRRGKRSVVINLRHPDGVATLLDLVATADALIEGYRPGVTDRLGIGPEACWARNPRLVYGRMTGWGQTGPWSQMAGHDINYISVTGVLNAIGEEGRVPPPPLNVVGDYGGGSLFLIVGVLAALLRARETGRGEVVDAAICDAAFSLGGILQTLDAAGSWTPKRQSNMLDGGAPYYRCYATSDGKFMAVGCIEAQFFAEMLAKLGIDPADYGPQNDRSRWPEQHRKLEAVYASNTRDHWAALFDGSDACVTPVLDYREAAAHKHMAARGAVTEVNGLRHTGPAPRFGPPKPFVPNAPARRGTETAAVLAELGRTPEQIEALAEAGAVALPAARAASRAAG